MTIGPTASSFLEAKQRKNERKDPSTGAGGGGDLVGENRDTDGPPRRDGCLGCKQKWVDGRRRPTTNKDRIVRNMAHGWVKRSGHPAGPGGSSGRERQGILDSVSLRMPWNSRASSLEASLVGNGTDMELFKKKSCK